MVVRGPRLSLRYGRADDAPALYELGRDPEVSRFFSWGPYTHQQQASASSSAWPTTARPVSGSSS
jgi:[ribosomal protein S5]-alanine N-acetyltransferase